jgi:hypothetical protein
MTDIAPAPATQVLDRYRSQFTALGAAEIEMPDEGTISLVFHDNFQGTQASGALAQAIDGVKLLVDNRSLTMDYWEVNADNVAQWMRDSSLFTEVDVRETSPSQIVGFAEEDRIAGLPSLLRPELADGTTISIMVQPVPESAS